MKEIIHFAHGNGFPSPCYRQLLEPLQTHYHCCFIDKIGHNPEFPVTDNWHFLINEVLTSVKLQANQPVIAVGHSLGGVLSVLAAIEEPALFKAVIILDSPLISRFKSSLLRLAKVWGVVDKITPASRTRQRKTFWATREEVLVYLKTKPLFKSFTEACLHDYIDYGLEKNKKGYTLRFDPQIEYSIYRTIPHFLRLYERQLVVPTALIYGDKSKVIGWQERRYMKKYYHIEAHRIKGSHMFPMEHPTQAAEKILELMSSTLLGLSADAKD